MNHLKNPGFDTVQTLYGGYHRYGFTDHAYLYNLYFPTSEMLDHMRNHFKDLVANYPVGQKVLSQLLSRWTGDRPEHLVVGNGAAELIKIISSTLDKKIIIPVPSFNEYINAGSKDNIKTFALAPPFFKLDVNAFGKAAVESKADIAVVVTPNNPTSLHVPCQDIKTLARHLAQNNIRLIVDESFMEFVSPENRAPMAKNLHAFPNSCVIKSMSKAFGICGLRLGYMAGADESWIRSIRKGVHIWNINSIAEEFLRILPDYRDAFFKSCEKVIEDRDYLYTQLKSIPGLDVFKPDANFVFVKLPESSADARDIAQRSYEKTGILIKDCKTKDMPDANRYLRIASRTKRENDRLVGKLAEIVNSGQLKIK